jgi:CRP-like cAMP-binding protein
VTTKKSPLPIDALPIFQGLSPAEVQELIQGGVAVGTKHREALFRAGDPAEYVALVVLGAYKLVRHDLAGNESVMHFASPGDTIGALVMLHPKGVFPVTCVSIGVSMVLKIPRATYLKSWAGNALLQQRISGLLYSRMNQIQGEKAQQRQHLSVKVAHLLLSLLEKYSEGSEHVLPIPITRQELADSVGATVESVIRLMSDWAAEGILKPESRQIEVLRLDRLVEVSKGA